MKRKTISCLFITCLQMIIWVAVIGSRPLASFYHVAPEQEHNTAFSSGSLDFKQGLEFDQGETLNNEEVSRRVTMSMLGSRPPSCVHKCGGCSPCYAIQMPTTTDRLGLHYSNYEPEGWKCKCGTTIFNP